MPAQTQVASDIVGLLKTAPVSRRSFMSASAAAAAGYTLAAGPVCAEAIKTSTDGLSAGGAKVKVADGEMPVGVGRVPQEKPTLPRRYKDDTHTRGHIGANLSRRF